MTSCISDVKTQFFSESLLLPPSWIWITVQCIESNISLIHLYLYIHILFLCIYIYICNIHIYYFISRRHICNIHIYYFISRRQEHSWNSTSCLLFLMPLGVSMTIHSIKDKVIKIDKNWNILLKQLPQKDEPALFACFFTCLVFLCIADNVMTSGSKNGTQRFAGQFEGRQLHQWHLWGRSSKEQNISRFISKAWMLGDCLPTKINEPFTDLSMTVSTKYPHVPPN